MKMITMGGVALMAGSVIVGGCSRTSEPDGAPGVGERSGAAVDNAAGKTADAAKAAGVKTKEVTGVAIEKTGEVMEKAGKKMDETGEKMQEK